MGRGGEGREEDGKGDKGRGAGREEEGRGEDSRRGNQWTRGIGVERRDVNGRVVERREGQ